MLMHRNSYVLSSNYLYFCF